jgi:hypothetical protein
MTHSLIGADRNTHLKIICVALLGAILVVTVGIGARVAGHGEASLGVQAEAPVLKAGKPRAVTAGTSTSIQ